ncbi:hypothetical protein Dsin_029117 [Dipteronia sinensis]|uniref:BED-type domain-containing protein n=1 Tax=Dipteronia sinensis TaxID=43782 RepID=A0AAD9ZTB9_9ROSI|nr:hypothetical protein Dsin_029117 [Dipteronia sinensis]
MPDLGHDGDEPDGPDPNPPQDFDFDPQMEEKLPKQVKSDLFVLHMKKVTHEDGSTVVICNYCKKVFKWHKSGGYGTYRKHITNSHPDAQAKSSSQAQIPSNVCGLLKVFYTATNNLSGLNIAGAFAHCESDSQLHECVTAMKDKWLEYYKEFPNIYLIALCFDPRCRLESLPDYLSVYYEQGLKIDYDVDMCCARVKTLLYELYDEYLKVYGPSLNIDVPQNQNVSRSSSSSSGFVNLRYNLLSKKTKKLRGYSSSSSTIYSELESYLSTSFGFIEDTEDKKFDILHWWKEHERYFPILAMIAKQILSTPVSTVAVEQQFSAGGNILDPKRSLISPKSLQIQACVEYWTKAQYRQQEIDQEEPYDFFKDDQPAESRTDDHGND